jgi:hypothetical protein
VSIGGCAASWSECSLLLKVYQSTSWPRSPLSKACLPNLSLDHLRAQITNHTTTLTASSPQLLTIISVVEGGGPGSVEVCIRNHGGSRGASKTREESCTAHKGAPQAHYSTRSLLTTLVTRTQRCVQAAPILELDASLRIASLTTSALPRPPWLSRLSSF